LYAQNVNLLFITSASPLNMLIQPID